MNKETHYSDGEIGEYKLISDFLPSPSELVIRNKNTKVTLSLSTESVAYFKEPLSKNSQSTQAN